MKLELLYELSFFRYLCRRTDLQSCECGRCFNSASFRHINLCHVLSARSENNGKSLHLARGKQSKVVDSERGTWS